MDTLSPLTSVCAPGPRARMCVKGACACISVGGGAVCEWWWWGGQG